jgi:hypothetical protein
MWAAAIHSPLLSMTSAACIAPRLGRSAGSTTRRNLNGQSVPLPLPPYSKCFVGGAGIWLTRAVFEWAVKDSNLQP